MFVIVVINWLNKQMNDQMMSQQRLGPFEMHTKTVSSRGPPLAPYNKVPSALLVLNEPLMIWYLFAFLSPVLMSSGPKRD